MYRAMVALLGFFMVGNIDAFRGPGLWPHRGMSMRSRHGLAPMSSNITASGGIAGFFGINRDTPEAKENQLAWAREQMAYEVPSSTLDGTSIDDREDFVTKYIESEKAKFGRELTREEAEREVDQWLLKQATFAPAKSTAADIFLAVAVFLGAFGVGIFLNGH
ncbi:hypothetical protein AB1Y20_022042 [Prymnesium parvum]|uniref:Uncharacterized protein n=1 Tax=Prymnesium parvum TaxID=97485 RepID=A0AB34JF66_PRYPA